MPTTELYHGEPSFVSYANSLDEEDIAKFKLREHHERFNGMVKVFKSTASVNIIHGKARYKKCFEAVCVICQYMMEMVGLCMMCMLDQQMETMAVRAQMNWGNQMIRAS